MIIFLICWVLYLAFGLLWLNHSIKNDIIKEYNMLGSLMLVTLWPIHMLYVKLN